MHVDGGRIKEEGIPMKQETKHAYVFPDPVALVTVADGHGGANIITLAWVGMASSDPRSVTIAIRPTRHSHGLLTAAGEFCLNIPGEELVRETDWCGVHSGRDFDKWAETGLTPEPSVHIAAPRITQCRYALECTVTETVHIGVHDLFVARVEAAFADPEILNDRGHVDYTLLRPMAYMPDQYWSLGERIYGYGDSKKDAPAE
jgi:flavin reductase (DIM6/NTAB) family NADH-FMN oxidoreductase RutF